MSPFHASSFCSLCTGLSSLFRLWNYKLIKNSCENDCCRIMTQTFVFHQQSLKNPLHLFKLAVALICVFSRFSRIQRTMQALPNVGLLQRKMGANCLFIPFLILFQQNAPYVLPLSALSLFVFILLQTKAEHTSFCLAVLFFPHYAPIYFSPVFLFSWPKFSVLLWSRRSSLHPPHCL